MKPFLVLLAVSLALSSLAAVAKASEIQFYEISSEIIDNAITKNAVTIALMPGAKTLEYPILSDVTEFSWRANFQANCTMARKTASSLISCDVSSANATARTVYFNYLATGSVREIEKNNRWLFSYNYLTSVPVSSLSVMVKLPEGTALVEKETNKTITGLLPFSPIDGEKRTDGRRIMLEWNRNNLTAGENLGFSVFYEVVTPTGISPVIMGFIALLGGLVLVFVYLYIKKGGNIIILDDSLDSILPVLRDDERRVIDCLLKENGEIAQRKVVYETNFSKAKVSRLIKDLSDRKIIRVEEKGRINKLHLLKKPKKPFGTIEAQKNAPDTQNDQQPPSA